MVHAIRSTITVTLPLASKSPRDMADTVGVMDDIIQAMKAAGAGADAIIEASEPKVVKVADTAQGALDLPDADTGDAGEIPPFLKRT